MFRDASKDLRLVWKGLRVNSDLRMHNRVEDDTRIPETRDERFLAYLILRQEGVETVIETFCAQAGRMGSLSRTS